MLIKVRRIKTRNHLEVTHKVRKMRILGAVAVQKALLQTLKMKLISVMRVNLRIPIP